MPDFAQRSTEIEIMDDLNCTGPILERTLIELEIINKWLGGNKITIDSIEELLKRSDLREVTIVDLGCGSGDMLRIVEDWGKRKKLKLKLIGVDANPHIVSFAKKNLRDHLNIQLQTSNIFSPEFQNQTFDIVIGTLFYHHFSQDQLIHFFKLMKDNVRIGFVINDIHRHWLAYHSIRLLTRAFSKSSMVKYDAPLSVRRAFQKDELIDVLSVSGMKNISIRWRWAFRWQVIAKTSE